MKGAKLVAGGGSAVPPPSEQGGGSSARVAVTGDAGERIAQNTAMTDKYESTKNEDGKESKNSLRRRRGERHPHHAEDDDNGESPSIIQERKKDLVDVERRIVFTDAAVAMYVTRSSDRGSVKRFLRFKLTHVFLCCFFKCPDTADPPANG